MGNAKIMCIINTNALRGGLSENYLTRKFITRNTFDMKYSQFTVICGRTLSNIVGTDPEISQEEKCGF